MPALNYFSKYILLICLFISTKQLANAQNNINTLVEKYNTTTDSKDKATLLDKITDYYFSLKNADSLIHYGNQAIDVYQKLGNAEQVAKNQLMVAMSSMEKAEVSQCEQYLKPALDFYKDKKDIRRYARSITLEGVILQHKQQFEPSVLHFKEVIDLYNQGEKSIDGHSVYIAYRGLFGSYTFSQQYDEALKASDQYFDFVQNNYPNEVGSAHFQLGTLYSYTYDSKKAVNEFLRAKAFYNKQNNKDAIAAINLQLGMAYVAMKNTDSAITLLNQAKDHFNANNRKDEEATVFYALAGAAKEKKDYNLANIYIDEAIKLSSTKNQIYDYLPSEKKKIELQILMADSLGIVSNPIKKAQLSATLLDFKKLFNIKASKNTGLSSPHELIESHLILSKAYVLLSDYESAYHNYKLSTTLKDSIFGTNKMRNLVATEADINLEREKDRIKFEEATKLLQLQKEKELAALHFEYETKQALAKTEEEKKG